MSPCILAFTIILSQLFRQWVVLLEFCHNETICFNFNYFSSDVASFFLPEDLSLNFVTNNVIFIISFIAFSDL